MISNHQTRTSRPLIVEQNSHPICFITQSNVDEDQYDYISKKNCEYICDYQLSLVVTFPCHQTEFYAKYIYIYILNRNRISLFIAIEYIYIYHFRTCLVTVKHVYVATKRKSFANLERLVLYVNTYQLQLEKRLYGWPVEASLARYVQLLLYLWMMTGRDVKPRSTLD
jgi:hypothetical protein